MKSMSNKLQKWMAGGKHSAAFSRCAKVTHLWTRLYNALDGCSAYSVRGFFSNRPNSLCDNVTDVNDDFELNCLLTFIVK